MLDPSLSPAQGTSEEMLQKKEVFGGAGDCQQRSEEKDVGRGGGKREVGGGALDP